MTAVSDKRTATSVRAVVGLLVLFEITSGFIQGGVVPLLPDLGDALGISTADLNWVISVQLLAAAVSVPVFGRLGDLYGHRRLLRIALICVAAGSVLVAVAPSLPLLLLGRVLLGPLAALLPLEIALVRDRLPVEQARSAIARLVGSLTLGVLLGGVLSAGLHQAIGSVRGTLLVPAMLALICVPVSFLAVPETRTLARGRLDLPGAALLSVGMIGVLLGISALDSDTGLGLALLGAGVVVLVVWAVVELRTTDPLVDLRALKAPTVAPYFACSFAFGIVYFGSQSPDTTFLAADREVAGYGFGLSALNISLVSLPAAVAAIIGSTLTVRLATRLGYQRTLAGAFVAIAVGFTVTAVFHDAIWQLVAIKVLLGLALGTALSAMPTVIAESADPSRTGITTALYNNVKTLGGAVAGGMVAAILAEAVLSGTDTPKESAYVAVWLMCAALCLGAAVLSARTRRAN
ncbi:MFS transporter [Paractinoplanes atraurantiacus]|uniref:Predicted arabinose efflux permease, MFS family n=1 Tax=Paractinoplanes atraurantiacus TaxID=1036182 RepID=A0A285H131_9ACTN|nr:MFS transporter [Actinoplanes atraurantiacus]SNY28476.1 Predicted arabinose efflux permease, MFS family [Actinoplanes atraurantiacus]